MRGTILKGAFLLGLAAMGTASWAQQPAPPAGSPPAGGPPRGGGLVQLVVESKAFEDGGVVPLKYSLYGTNTQKLDLPATATRPELWEAMKGKVAAKAAYSCWRSAE